MNNTYNITWLEEKEWQGKKILNVHLDGVEGSVSIWQLDKDGVAFPGFSELAPGSSVTGVLYTNPTKGTKTLYPPKAPSAPRSNFGGGAAAQKIKGEQIKEAQDRKEESIAYFNATNSAIAILSARYDLRNAGADATIRSLLQDWRDWFLKEHKSYKDNPPF